MKNKICTLMLAGLLTGVLAVSGGCGSTAGTSNETAEEEVGVVDVDEDDALGDDEEFDEDEEVESPYDSELEDYFTANTGEVLLKTHKNVLFKETVNNTDGSELYSYDLFDSPEQKLIHYTNGDQEFSESGDNAGYSGYDSETKTPYRYVFYDEEGIVDQNDAFDEFLYFWPGEGAEEKAEEGDEVIFTCYIRDPMMIEMLFYDEEGEIEENSYIERKLYFKKDSKEFEHAEGIYYHADGSTVDIGSCTMEFDTEVLTPDQEILDKLNSSDSHSLTLTLDAGTEDETVLTSTVGKGCTFYPAIPEGYVFYKDKDKKEEVGEEIWEETEEDIVLFGYYEEDLDGEEIEISEDDLSDIEDDGEMDEDVPELTEEEMQELIENGEVKG